MAHVTTGASDVSIASGSLVRMSGPQSAESEVVRGERRQFNQQGKTRRRTARDLWSDELPRRGNYHDEEAHSDAFVPLLRS
jgi:hypothetical protein